MKNAPEPMLVDDEDFDLIAAHKWRWTGRYPIAGQRSLLAHRLIMKPVPPQVVDHIDGDTLNNTRANLRICSSIQNLWNRRKQEGEGISQGLSGKWQVTFGFRGMQFRAYGIDTPEMAQDIRDDILSRIRGEFHKERK